MLTTVALQLTLAAAAFAQTTYTGCHNHTSGSATVLYCYGPNGQESARATFLASDSATITSSAVVGATTTSSAGAQSTPTASAAGQTTAVTGCHSHATAVFCINGGGAEVQVMATPTGPLPAVYTDCHSHGSSTYCLDPAGQDVAIVAEGASVAAEEELSGCHYHAGVEHCPGQEATCGLRSRGYDIGLRIGSLFIVLVTSSIGVFAPLVLHKLSLGRLGSGLLLVVKQFGTGVIIATAFIHLYTHADLMFSNHCLGELGYEATTSAVVMVGIFLSFLIEYIGMRFVGARNARSPTASSTSLDTKTPSTPPNGALTALDHHHLAGPNTKLSVIVMESGIVFHSILIGVTLVVAGDDFYRTLLVVIVFHQFFEGLALGARIALLPGKVFPGRYLMALTFALITPIGMAIGIGVLNSFNGNSPATVITFGTLDALSAGVLIWVGVVDMWARDWVIEGGEMTTSGWLKSFGAGLSLVAGFALMGLLGKWA